MAALAGHEPPPEGIWLRVTDLDREPGGAFTAERIRDAARRISICEDTAEILDPLARRLQAALQALRQVPHDLGEVYELVYEFIRGGGKMPRFGMWIEGATQA